MCNGIRFRGGLAAWVVATGLGLLSPGPEAAAIKRQRPVEAKGHREAVLITAKSNKTRKEMRCCGVLVAGNVVLTAAHCTQGFDAWDVVVPYAEKGPARVHSKTARAHPDYQPRKYDNDLALLILESAVSIDQKFPALYGGDPLRLGRGLVVVGRVHNGKVSNDRLYLSSGVTIVGDQQNVNVYGGTPPVIDRGDSGGPVYNGDNEQELVAVVSGYIDFDGEPVPTDIFAPLNAKKQDWIKRVIQQAQSAKDKRKDGP